MNLEEYQKVKNYDYDKYCKYLQEKYGIPQGSYFLTNSFKSKNTKITRGKEGLFIHHIKEDETIMLSTPEYAVGSPFEFQEGYNLVYCDFLEHLFLHILIVEKRPLGYGQFAVGQGGIENFIMPELNDLYSGWLPKQPYKIVCFNLIKDNKQLYFELIKRYYHLYLNRDKMIKENKLENSSFGLYLEDKLNKQSIKDFFSNILMHRSINEKYGLWSSENNIPLSKEWVKYLNNN